MKQTFIFLLLAAAVFLVRPVSAESTISQSKAKDLNGREVLVRVYDNWQENPEEYKEVYAQLDGTTVVLDSNDIDESAFIVLVGEDQEDKAIGELMGNLVCAESYNKGLRFKLPRGGSFPYQLKFKDAIGNPISQANVEIFLYGKKLGKASRILLGDVELDESGCFEAPLIKGSLNKLYLVLSHPSYGIHKRTVACCKKYELWFPVVPEGTEAYERSIRGYVVDDANNPISGASIKCDAIYLPDGVEIDASGKVITDEKGWFHLYPIIRTEIKRIMGKLIQPIPPRSKYKVWIEAPKEMGLVPYVGTIINDANCATVKMADYGYFRTFVFEDETGQITSRAKLEEIWIEIERKDKPSLRYDYYGSLRNGRFLAPGTYKGYAWDGELHKFEPLEVTEDSPEELVLTLEKEITYCGRVVNGVSGKPMAGVLILSSSHAGDYIEIRRRMIPQITPEQWNTMRNVGANSSTDEEARKLFQEIFHFDKHFDKIVCTDANGQFEIRSGQGRKILRFLALEEDYLDVKERAERVEPDANGRIQLPTIPLFPAAKVIVEPRIQDMNSTVSYVWLIDTNDCPEWVGRPQDIERYESIHNLNRPSVDWQDTDVNEIIDLEPEFPRREYNPYLGFFSYMLVDFLMTDRFWFFGIPVTVRRDYDYTWSNEPVKTTPSESYAQVEKPLDIEPNDDSIWMEEASEETKEDPNRRRTLMELILGYDNLRSVEELRRNVAQAIYVPAGVRLKLELSGTGYRKDGYRRTSPVIIPQIIYLSKGETLDLGKQELEQTVKIFVKVVDSAGRPVKGAPVGIWFKGIQLLETYNTDENGRFAYTVAPHTKGKLYVSVYGYRRKLKEAISYEVGGGEDEGREFVLTLSDEMLQRLFKQGAPLGY